jgi:hypothetical protein
MVKIAQVDPTASMRYRYVQHRCPKQPNLGVEKIDFHPANLELCEAPTPIQCRLKSSGLRLL